MCTSCCHGCMAGQGETCSHIASVLFYIETFNRIRRKLACTDKQCEWILPTYSKDIPFAEVQDTDFRSSTKLKQNTVEKFDVNAPCVDPGDSKTTEKQKRDIQAPTEAELNSFYKKLNTCKKKPVDTVTICNFYLSLSGVKVCCTNSVRTPNNGNLKNRHFKQILSSTAWLDDDIILGVHLNLKKIDPTMQGLQDPLLGPVCQFRRVSNRAFQCVDSR